ncbi:HNH endonuclease [Dongia sp.]|uniref:HNH endonuclease n=1 Tax=Dongia sp. TaxID=1977262 RepID=UPI0035B23AE6
MSQGRDIPTEIMRAVRQKCGFGCIICGLPVFHYDHIEEYASVKGHDVDNIVLLCPNHHQDKTSGRLTKNVIKTYAKSPANLLAPRTTAHMMHLRADDAVFIVGSNSYHFQFSETRNHFNAIVLDGLSVLGMSNDHGQLTLNLRATDATGREILRIRGGCLSVSTGVWDYDISGRRISIRSGMRIFDLEMEILPNGLSIKRGYLRGKASQATIYPDRIIVTPGKITFQNCNFRNCDRGLVVR